jgi:hypothetical protein
MQRSWSIWMLLGLLSTAPFQATAKSISGWSNRLLPLPKQIKIEGSKSLLPEEAVLILPESSDRLIATAVELLRPLATGRRGFEIRLVLTTGEENSCPFQVRQSLQNLPNRDQAYAIEPILRGGKFSGLLLAANTPLGLLYSARTLAQVVAAPPPDKTEEIPAISLLDWPDLSERGEWGGNAAHDIKWMSERKFNLVELHATLGFDEDGSPKASLDPGMLDEAARSGIKVVPIILHLEQLAGTGLFRFHPQVAATPDPEKPLPTDYEPSVCFSEPRTVELLSGWMERLLAIPGVNEVMVWLSETRAPCYCYRCKGKEPFVMEVQGIQKAFNEVRKSKPKAVLRILTTQASYEVNDKVLSAAAADTRFSYYDGGRTYDSSHRPMIYPLMETFARSGRWLGVYPQLTNSWRTVFPFTGPQFIHTRMKEFVDKKLSCLAGYATPSNRYYEFNITAAAEWSWNSGGRNPREFAEVYASRAGMAHPQHFAEWAEMIGDIGWDLAGSRVIEGLVFNPGRTLSEKEPEAGVSQLEVLPAMRFGEGLLSEFPNLKHFQDRWDLAKRALKLAETEGDQPMVDESRSDLSALELLDGLRELSDTKSLPTEARIPAVKSALAKIDEASRMLTISLYRWGMAVNPVDRNTLPSRFRDTVNLASRVASNAWELGKSLGIEDPHPAYRLQLLREWTQQDFSSGVRATLLVDVTDVLPAAGECDVTFQFLDGTVGLDLHSVELLRGASKETAQPIDEERWDFHVGRWDRWIEYWVTVPQVRKVAGVTGDRSFLRINASLPVGTGSSDPRTSHGRILFRRSWRGERL